MHIFYFMNMLVKNKKLMILHIKLKILSINEFFKQIFIIKRNFNYFINQNYILNHEQIIIN